MCHGDEENGHRACTNGHLTTADQSEIRKAYLASVFRQIKSNSSALKLDLVVHYGRVVTFFKKE